MSIYQHGKMTVVPGRSRNKDSRGLTDLGEGDVFGRVKLSAEVIQMFDESDWNLYPIVAPPVGSTPD